jgi:hypothetical protein
MMRLCLHTVHWMRICYCQQHTVRLCLFLKRKFKLILFNVCNLFVKISFYTSLQFQYVCLRMLDRLTPVLLTNQHNNSGLWGLKLEKKQVTEISNLISFKTIRSLTADRSRPSITNKSTVARSWLVARLVKCCSWKNRNIHSKLTTNKRLYSSNYAKISFLMTNLTLLYFYCITMFPCLCCCATIHSD